MLQTVDALCRAAVHGFIVTFALAKTRSSRAAVIVCWLIACALMIKDNGMQVFEQQTMPLALRLGAFGDNTTYAEVFFDADKVRRLSAILLVD